MAGEKSFNVVALVIAVLLLSVLMFSHPVHKKSIVPVNTFKKYPHYGSYINYDFSDDNYRSQIIHKLDSLSRVSDWEQFQHLAALRKAEKKTPADNLYIKRMDNSVRSADFPLPH